MSKNIIGTGLFRQLCQQAALDGLHESHLQPPSGMKAWPTEQLPTVAMVQEVMDLARRAKAHIEHIILEERGYKPGDIVTSSYRGSADKRYKALGFINRDWGLQASLLHIKKDGSEGVKTEEHPVEYVTIAPKMTEAKAS